MANLRTNNLSGEQGQNAYRGSVYFPGYVNGAASSYLSIADNDDLDMGTGDFTFEAWIRPVKHAGTNDPNYMGFFSSQDYANSGGSITIQVKNDGKLRYIINNSEDETGSTVLWGHYHHVAIVRSSGTIKGYVNGVEEISSSFSTAVDFTNGGSTVIGELAIDNYAGDYPFRGHISNLRLVKGTAVYTSAFTPPTSELTLIPNTVLLCCQDSDDPTQEATGKTITANGTTDLTNRTDNLIKNGRFTVSATENWTLSDGTAALGTGQSGTFGDGNHLVLTATSSYAYLKQSFTTVIGRTYRTDGQSNGGDQSFISTSTSSSDAVITDIRGGKTFIATQTTYHVILRGNTGGANFDTISVHELENSVQPKDIPPYGVDAGNTFGGPIQQSSEGYMCFPTGRTEERGRGRAVSWLGNNNSNGSYTKDVDFFDIQSQGLTTKFGELSDTVGLGAAMSSTTRGVFAGGTKPAVGNLNLLEFITIATTGNAVDFGSIGTLFRYAAGISNSTRGLIAGAYQGGGASGTKNVIQFITIASTGSTQDFGDIVANSGNGIFGAGSCQSSTRGITFGGGTPSSINEINSITIATESNSTDFGDLSAAKQLCQGVSSSTRGVVAGGDNSGAVNVIEFITIASAGNATDFGDLSSISEYAGSSGGSNKIRGVFTGRGDYPSFDNSMQFITIASTGNASDFGDVRSGGGTPYGSSNVSDSHGGL